MPELNPSDIPRLTINANAPAQWYSQRGGKHNRIKVEVELKGTVPVSLYEHIVGNANVNVGWYVETDRGKIIREQELRDEYVMFTVPENPKVKLSELHLSLVDRKVALYFKYLKISKNIGGSLRIVFTVGDFEVKTAYTQVLTKKNPSRSAGTRARRAKTKRQDATELPFPKRKGARLPAEPLARSNHHHHQRHHSNAKLRSSISKVIPVTASCGESLSIDDDTACWSDPTADDIDELMALEDTLIVKGETGLNTVNSTSPMITTNGTCCGNCQFLTAQVNEMKRQINEIRQVLMINTTRFAAVAPFSPMLNSVGAETVSCRGDRESVVCKGDVGWDVIVKDECVNEFDEALNKVFV